MARAGRGHVQRARQLLQEAEPPAPVTSKLATRLKRKFCWGKESAVEVQGSAADAVFDHTNSPQELVALAGLGTNGRHPSHCYHELMGLLRRQFPNCPEPKPFLLPMLGPKPIGEEETVVDTEHSILHPFEWFHYLHLCKPQDFSRKFLGGPDHHANPAVPLTRFWNSIADADPRKQAIKQAYLQRPDIVDEADLWARAVPVTIHGDAFPVASHSCMAISWSGFLTDNLSTIHTKMPISAMLNTCVAPGTYSVFWAMIVWSLMVLLSGAFPSRDWMGHALVEASDIARAADSLAGGLFCVVWVVKGDMEFIQNYLWLEGASCVSICPWCLANTVEDWLDRWAAMFDVLAAPWNDINPLARWRATVWHSAQAWLAYHGGILRVHPLFTLPGVSILSLMADILHIVDLGVAHHIIGNVLFELCFNARYLPGSATPAARLDTLWRRIAVHYRAKRVPDQIQGLTLSMFCDPKGPNAHYPLLVNRVKAAQTRHLVPVLRDIFETLVTPADPTDQAIMRMLSHLSDFYQLVDDTDYNMPGHVVEALQGHFILC